MSKYKGAWPPPVYVATFADGTTQRASFATPYGKPLDFVAGRRMACHFARDWERYDYEMRTVGSPGVKVRLPTYGSIKSSLERYHTMPPRSDLVSGYVEFDGQEFPDPMTEAKPVKLSAADKLIAQFNKLSRTNQAHVREGIGW